jgi:dTDP-4-dehydrorhamnose reductase
MRLLTGSSGMIGKNLKELLSPMLCPTHAELDLTDREQVKKYLDYHKPEQIIHCASNDDEVCLYDNLRMFVNLAESNIPMITFATGRNIENRPGKVGEYILSKYIAQELALNKYNHITVLKIWGCFGKYEKESRFFTDNMLRIKRGEPILVRENKLFSYVYVKDLAKIINMDNEPILHNIIGYTQSLLYYARILKRVTGSPHEIVVENRTGIDYAGWNTFYFDYTPLPVALKEMWSDFNNNSK